jgi:hypothetical protein
MRQIWWAIFRLFVNGLIYKLFYCGLKGFYKAVVEPNLWQILSDLKIVN